MALATCDLQIGRLRSGSDLPATFKRASWRLVTLIGKPFHTFQGMLFRGSQIGFLITVEELVCSTVTRPKQSYGQIFSKDFGDFEAQAFL